MNGFEMKERAGIEASDMESALHTLRVEAAYCQMREFPMFGSDVLNIMASAGLCTQDQADRAVADARGKMERDLAADAIMFAAPSELEGPPTDHPDTNEQ